MARVLASSGCPLARTASLTMGGAPISQYRVTATPVPEWDGQKVFVMMEDDAFLTDEGYRFFRPRQEAWYVVR